MSGDPTAATRREGALVRQTAVLAAAMGVAVVWFVLSL